ncbi:MAG: hypothetical protein PVS2B2_04920 [Candidatus Acidiferrum sp.]
MEFSNREGSAQKPEIDDIPHLPRLWVGYVLGAATLIAEIVAVSLHPEIAKLPLVVPPLYLFLPSFISLVYWLVCVYEYHVVLAYLTAEEYSIRPVRAAWRHLIPVYQFYWAFKWAREFAGFVNSHGAEPALKPDRAGLYIFSGFLIFILFDRGFGMILLCMAASKLSASLQRALEEALVPRKGLPFS